jgi:protein TonB
MIRIVSQTILGMAGMAALALAATPCASARDIVWPLPPCDELQLVSASPAPMPSDTSSLTDMPLSMGGIPSGVAFVASLDRSNAPVLRCFVAGASDPRLLAAGSVAAAGLHLSTPLRPNGAMPEPLYLIAISNNFGISWVEQPPPQPLLPSCPEKASGLDASLPDAPKPTSRVPPRYPFQAENAGIEGSVQVVLETFSTGAAVPRCIAASAPAGWFEFAAIRALEQWRFAPAAGAGPHLYRVRVNFRLE